MINLIQDTYYFMFNRIPDTNYFMETGFPCYHRKTYNPVVHAFVGTTSSLDMTDFEAQG